MIIMKTREIFLFIIALFMTYLVFQNEIFYFFEKKLSKKDILLLEKEAKDNNISAVANLAIMYKKQGNEELLKKWMHKYAELLCTEYKECLSRSNPFSVGTHTRVTIRKPIPNYKKAIIPNGKK